MTGVTAEVAARREAKADAAHETTKAYYEKAHKIIQEDYDPVKALDAPATHRGQTYWESLLEAKTNIAIGFVISWLVWVLVITPLWGFPFELFDSLAITGIFTVTSLARQFVVRRWFNGRSKV